MKFRIIHHCDQEGIDDMYNHYVPVFILSTGRSGSKYIAALLDNVANICAFHEPRPTLEYFVNYAYHHQVEENVLSRMIDAARMESILEVYIKEQVYVESNQCLTYFAPVISRLYKQSKFVHLIRHPGNFTRSGVRKGWYKNDSIWEAGRVKPHDNKAHHEQWENMDQVERLAWSWTAINSYIEEFKKSIEPDRTRTFTFEELTQEPSQVKELLNFIGAQPLLTDEQIKNIQNNKINEIQIHPWEPPNMKKVAHYPRYEEWEQAEKQKLKQHCAGLAETYGYNL